jgi:hypothetical protein
MPLQKGCKPNNPAGRKVGSKNTATTELKLWVKTLLETNQAQFEADLLSVEPKERLQIMTALLKYTIPTIQSTELKTDLPKHTVIRIGYGSENNKDLQE